MSVPPSQPPQGPWQPPPSTPGQPPTPPPGQPPQGQPYGSPVGQYPGWYPPGPPKKNNALKWALGAVALIAVIAIAVAVTLALTHGGTGSGPSDTGGSGSAAGIASANDTGPVSVITDEPTCDRFNTINNGLADQGKNGWNNRDASIPATEWTPDQRAQYDAIGAAMRNAAEQLVALAKQTPHRVVRELYEQFIAYSRAYADSIPTYTASDDDLASVVIDIEGSMQNLCSAISQGSASSRGPSVPAATPPSHSSPVSDPARSQRFLSHPDPACNEWASLVDKFSKDTSAWKAIDSAIPASQWTPEQKAVNDAVQPVMSTFADSVENLGRRSTNPVFYDLAALNAQYLRAYVHGLPTYVPSDSYLYATSAKLGQTITYACSAVGG